MGEGSNSQRGGVIPPGHLRGVVIHEMRTYALKPGTVAEFEAMFAEVLPHLEQHSKLGAFWHTELGPLNQVIQVWPYENLGERDRIRERASKGLIWPPEIFDILLSMESVILTPAPFMRPLGDHQLGNVYEMRLYTYRPGTIQEVVKRWSETIPLREKYSPLAACWYTELGGLNRLIHVWPYRDMAERERVRAEAAKDSSWRPGTRHLLVSQENKILAPAAFSPMR